MAISDRGKQSSWQWQPPPNEGKDNAPKRQDWLQQVVSVGEAFNASLTSSRDLPRGISMISGRTADVPNQQRSNLKIPREKRALREVVANISDIRTVDAYSSENKSYSSFLEMYNKIWKSIHFESKFQPKFKRAVQWMTVGGYSYMSPVYRNLYQNRRSARRIDFDVYSSQDCLPFQLPDDNNVQGAYAWTRIKFMPLYEAHSKFPKFAAQIKPIARRRYSGNISKDRIALAERFRNDMRTSVGQSQGGNWTEQMAELRYTTVRDLSINETKEPKPMGEPGALESYVVPFVGQMIPTANWTIGINGAQPKREMRKAEEEDCYLYPNLRLFISQTGMSRPIYDGPFWDWHGMHPLVRISADEWPWEPGYSLAQDIDSLGETRQKFMRGLDQTAAARFDPAFLYDKGAGINRKTMESFDPYEERGRLGVDGPVDEKTIRTALPEELLTIPEWGFAWEKTLEDKEDYLLGLNAMDNLAKAKVAGADDALLKAMEEAGPIVKDISTSCNDPVADLMEMCLALVLQYYPTGRVMQYVGADGTSREIFDLDPSSLIPSHMPGENKEEKSAFTKMERVQNLLSAIHATIAPGELHGTVQTARKLLMLQMQRSGFMIDSETVAKACDIPNWGTLDGNTVLEKWQSEQQFKLEFATKMKELETSLVLEGAAGPPPVSPLLNAGKAQPGRPPSGRKPPELVTKGSAEGPRAAIVES